MNISLFVIRCYFLPINCDYSIISGDKTHTYTRLLVLHPLTGEVEKILRANTKFYCILFQFGRLSGCRNDRKQRVNRSSITAVGSGRHHHYHCHCHHILSSYLPLPPQIAAPIAPHCLTTSPAIKISPIAILRCLVKPMLSFAVTLCWP